jgi:hypothetical protein
VVIALSGWWIFGWIVAAVVIAIAAALLLAIIGLGRRIAGQADEITEALDGARENTEALWEVKSINLALHRIVTGLGTAREALTR